MQFGIKTLNAYMIIKPQVEQAVVFIDVLVLQFLT